MRDSGTDREGFDEFGNPGISCSSVC